MHSSALNYTDTLSVYCHQVGQVKNVYVCEVVRLPKVISLTRRWDDIA